MSDDKIAEIRERWAEFESLDHQSQVWDAHLYMRRAHNDRATLLAEVDRLRADLALEKSGFVLQRGQVEKLRAKIDELMRSHEMCANAMRAESDRADEAWAEVEKQRAEIERLRKRDEEWTQKAATWLASPEAERRLDGYRELAARVEGLTCERDEARAEVERLRAALEAKP